MNQVETFLCGVGRAARSWPSAPRVTFEGCFERLAPHPADVALLGPLVSARLEAGLETCVQYRLRDAPARWVEEWSLPRGDERVVIVRPAPAAPHEPSKIAWLGGLRHDLSNQQFLLRTSLAGLDASALPPELAEVRADLEHIATHCAGVIRTLEDMVGRRAEQQSIELAQFLTKNQALLRRVADPHALAVAADGHFVVTAREEGLRAALVALVGMASAVAADERDILVTLRSSTLSAGLTVALHGSGPLDRRTDLELSALHRSLRAFAEDLGAHVGLEGGELTLRFLHADANPAQLT